MHAQENIYAHNPNPAAAAPKHPRTHALALPLPAPAPSHCLPPAAGPGPFPPLLPPAPPLLSSRQRPAPAPPLLAPRHPGSAPDPPPPLLPPAAGPSPPLLRTLWVSRRRLILGFSPSPQSILRLPPPRGETLARCLAADAHLGILLCCGRCTFRYFTLLWKISK